MEPPLILADKLHCKSRLVAPSAAVTTAIAAAK